MLLCVMGERVTPFSHGWGVPHPIMGGGTPSSHGQRVPHPVLCRGGTSSSPGQGGTPSSPGQGGTPFSPGWGIGVTPSSSELAVPPTIQIWDGIPPSRPGMGYAPIQTWDGVPPRPPLPPTHPPSSCGLTHNVKILPSPILRMRAVISSKYTSSTYPRQ